MPHEANFKNTVNPELKAVNGHDSDFIWGADEIGRIIGRSSRQAHHLLAAGAVKSAKKIGGRWVASRTALLRELGGG